MKNRIFLLSIILLFLNLPAWGQHKQIIKVACIGNSITYGAGIKDNIRDAYPAQLARMLGNNYYVRNYGYSARTMLDKGDHPFMAEPRFRDAIKWKPDIVIIMLGTNDSKSKNWKYKDDFEKDYLKMVTAFDTLSPKSEIYAVAPVPAFSNAYTISEDVIKNEIYPLVKKVAKEKNICFLDLYHPLLSKGDMFPDGIHPDVNGSGEMAKVIYEELTGKKGELVKQEYPGVRSDWHGFDKYGFDIFQRAAHLLFRKNRCLAIRGYFVPASLTGTIRWIVSFYPKVFLLPTLIPTTCMAVLMR